MLAYNKITLLVLETKYLKLSKGGVIIFFFIEVVLSQSVKYVATNIRSSFLNVFWHNVSLPAHPVRRFVKIFYPLLITAAPACHVLHKSSKFLLSWPETLQELPNPKPCLMKNLKILLLSRFFFSKIKIPCMHEKIVKNSWIKRKTVWWSLKSLYLGANLTISRYLYKWGIN